MTKEEFIQLSEQLTQQMNEYGSTIPVSRKEFMTTRFSKNMNEILTKIIANDWTGLIGFCEDSNFELENKKVKLKVEQGKLNEFFEKLFNLKDGFAEFAIKPNTSTNWEEDRNFIIRQMVDAGIPSERATAFTDKFGRLGGLTAYNFFKRFFNQQTDFLNYTHQEILASTIYNFLAITICKYNIASAIAQDLPFDVLTRINSLRRRIANKLDEIYDLSKDRNTSQLIEFVNDFDSWISLKLEEEIIPILADTHQKLKSPDNNFLHDGRRAMKAGTLLFETFFAKALCGLVSWICKWHGECKTFSEFFENASKLLNIPVEQIGSEVSISDLVENPQEFDMKDVIVEGLVKKLTIKHVGLENVISMGEINNASNQNIRLLLNRIKLPSGGLVNDCYAKIAGRFVLNNPNTNNEPTVIIDRLGFKELGESNWKAWLRYSLRDIIEVPAHNLSIDFSLNPGNDGAINPIKFDITSSESELYTFKNDLL